MSWPGRSELSRCRLVYRRTGSAIRLRPCFLICSQVLPALLAPAMVARLDRLSPRRVLPALYGLEAVLFGILAWNTHHFLLIPVLALSLADGAVATTARSLASAARAEILKPVDLLHEGNAVANICFSAAFMAGPVLGGAVVVAGRTIAALLVNCGFFATMALLLAVDPPARLHRRAGIGMAPAAPGSGPEPGPTPSSAGCWSSSSSAWSSSPSPSRWRSSTAQHTLHAGAGGYGALMGLWGAGAVAGSAIYARWRRKPAALLIGGSAIGSTAGFTVMAVAPTLAVALVGAALAGMATASSGWR